MIAVVIAVLVIGVAFYLMSKSANNSVQSSGGDILFSLPVEDESVRLERVRTLKAREISLLIDLNVLIELGDKSKIEEWLSGYYDTGNKVPGKVYAKAMAFIEGSKWLSDKEYDDRLIEWSKINDAKALEEKKAENDSAVIHKLVTETVDILLDSNQGDEHQIKQINQLICAYKKDEEFYNGMLKLGYWHAMHIIMNSNRVPIGIAKKARSDRQKVMSNLTRKKILSVPIHEVKSYLSGAGITLSSSDEIDYQNFAFVNHTRDFELPDKD